LRKGPVQNKIKHKFVPSGKRRIFVVVMVVGGPVSNSSDCRNKLKEEG
jgi:hypothetical protein